MLTPPKRPVGLLCHLSSLGLATRFPLIARCLTRGVTKSDSKKEAKKVKVYERKGLIGERTDEEIGIQTWRAGDITGEHTVMFGGIGERLELIHRAHNRDNFARGAVRAALWVVSRPKGLYDMQDVLGLR